MAKTKNLSHKDIKEVHPPEFNTPIGITEELQVPTAKLEVRPGPGQVKIKISPLGVGYQDSVEELPKSLMHALKGHQAVIIIEEKFLSCLAPHCFTVIEKP